MVRKEPVGSSIEAPRKSTGKEIPRIFRKGGTEGGGQQERKATRKQIPGMAEVGASAETADKTDVGLGLRAKQSRGTRKGS